MTDPKWISEELIIRLHERVIDIGGGTQGVRDTGLLASALARPQNVYAYGEDDVFQLAASYAESIARNHPFIDGNKRTAFQSADLFLALNGYDLDAASRAEHADMMEKLAQGLISRDEAAKHFQAYCRKEES